MSRIDKILNESQTLIDGVSEFVSPVEEATVCHKNDGFGIIVMIFSKDHTPPHAYAFTNEMVFKGRFELRNSAPTNASSVVEYRDVIDPTIKTKIAAWAQGTKMGVSNWLAAKIVWSSLHP